MPEIILPMLTALWLGILTAVSPCPLATNIAAIGFIGRKVDNGKHVLLSGLVYSLGRCIAYIAVGSIIVAGFVAVGEASRFLQAHVSLFFGPVLILAGMLLLEMFNTAASLSLGGEEFRQKLTNFGQLGVLVIGVLFALSFCPVSAGLFFLGLVPLAAREGSYWLLPAIYGVGTALPVVFFAFLMAFASQSVGKAFGRLTHIERWARTATGALFIAIGIHHSLVHVYGLALPKIF